MTSLNIAIANLQSGIGTVRGYWQYLFTAWKYRLPHDSLPVERGARCLADQGVDLALLCEVEGGSSRSRGVDQAELFCRCAGLPYRVFFRTRVRGARVNQGNAVVSRYPVEPVANHLLPGRGEPRYLSEAVVALPGGPVRLFVTHLSLERQMREPQIERIEALVDARQGPAILGGDFNIAEETELELLMESALHKALSIPSFPAWAPTRPLDHLFLTPHFEIDSAFVYERELFSDHLPLIARVRLLGG